MIKQLLTVIVACLVMTPSIMAQTFEFRYHGEPISDGGTVVIPAVEDDFGFGEMWCETNPSSNPSNGLILQLLSGTTATGNATMTITENTLNPVQITWCMGGLCERFINETTKDKEFSTNNGSVLVQFEAQNAQSEGVLLATLTATVGSETHSVIIKFVNGDVAVSGDVNGDGVCNSADVTALYQMILNNDDSKIVNGDQNGDNNINSADVTAVYKIILGSE